MTSATLEKALEQVDLQPGQTYRCRVRGLDVVVRVLSESIWPLPEPLDERDVMLDAWTDLKNLGEGAVASTQRVELWPPDIPEIPRDADDSDVDLT